MSEDRLAMPESSVEDRMREVVEVWDRAPWNAKKSASFRWYNAAVRAQADGNLAECIRRLDTAVALLS
ncbi:hypothetical protein [Hyphomonas sp.]|uniref:hypothetical protein n=1 Tax=Hyphomonas sp. TaxID=87 RepID=UPI00391CC2A2